MSARVSFVIVALGLAACAPQVPNSGVSYQDYMRNAQLNGSAPMTQPVQTYGQPQAQAQGFSTDGALAAINAAEGGNAVPVSGTGYNDANGMRPRGDAPSNIRVENGEMAAIAGHSAISNENNFDAVAAERSIQQDAAAIAQNRAQYQQIQPTAIPQRPDSSGGSAIVQFALQTSHPVGTQMYGRSAIRLTNTANACAKYPSADQAQIAFLEAGGPDRDRRGLDPDGDGYACGWDPSPFRAALR